MENQVFFKDHAFKLNDATLLKNSRPVFNKYVDEFIEGFYDFIFTFEHARRFIHNDEIFKSHKEAIKKWYLGLFGGDYGEDYIKMLRFISETHISIGLSSHYVNAAFGFVRRFVRKVALKEEKEFLLDSLDKLVDINLDVLTTTYQKGGQTKLMADVAFLRECNNKSTILPYAQPIFDSKTLKPEKYEALMRLQDPKDPTNIQSIFPYLKTAKNIKIYRSLTQIMIKKTFDFFSTTNHVFSINLSYEDIVDTNFIHEVFSYVEKCKEPSKIIFEIVETDLIKDFSLVQDFAKKARNYGCTIAIDDFGSGFSSLENILLIKPEIIKIDGSLIKHLDRSNECQIVVKNIINMAKDLHSKTVAEYIHNVDVMKKAQELGVDFLQGFYLGKPTPLKNLI